MLELLLLVGLQTQSPAANSAASLAELMAGLPHQVETKSFDLARFSQQVEPFAQGPAAGIRGATSMISADLRSPDSEVRSTTMALLYELDLREDGMELIAPFRPQIEQAALRQLETGTEPAGKLGLVILGARGNHDAGSAAVLKQEMISKKALAGQQPFLVGVLARIDPGDRQVDDLLGTKLADIALSAELRGQILHAASMPGAGPHVVRAVEQAAASSSKQERDNAIDAAARIGPNAVRPLKSLLDRIADDRSESRQSRINAQHALSLIPSQHPRAWVEY